MLLGWLSALVIVVVGTFVCAGGEAAVFVAHACCTVTVSVFVVVVEVWVWV